MNDVNIEIFDEECASNENTDLVIPKNRICVGTVESGSVQVYINQCVYKKIEEYAKAEMSKEVGTILIGKYAEKDGETTVIISDCIEARYTDATASTLTFTHKTWDYVYSEIGKNYSDKKIVGWQHTHPGYGIFLSNYDMFIQENFFNLPWQIAYVVDPIADTRGFFEWKNGKVEKLKGFYVYDNQEVTISLTEDENLTFSKMQK